MKRLKTISSQVVKEYPRWQLCQDEVQLRSGKVDKYFYIKTPGSVLVIPILPDGRLVLINQYRYLFDKASIEFPCGGIDNEENATDAGLRELEEETGYASDELMKMGSFATANGIAKDDCHVFAGLVDKAGELELDEFEEIEVILRRVDEFEEMIKRGEVWQGHTLSAWALARDRVYKIIQEQNQPT